AESWATLNRRHTNAPWIRSCRASPSRSLPRSLRAPGPIRSGRWRRNRHRAWSRLRSLRRHLCGAHVIRSRFLVSVALVALLVGSPGPQAFPAEQLPSYNVKLSETSVSGISSGAFMAVQFGVAYSSIVAGVGATAGGPYYCASDEAPAKFDIGTVLGRCMPGD